MILYILTCFALGFVGMKLWTAYQEEWKVDEIDEHESMVDELKAMEKDSND